MKRFRRLHAVALLLLAAALPAAALDLARDDVRDFAAEMADRHGFDRTWLDGLLGKAASQPRIVELMSRPAERVKPWHEYRDHFLTEARIDAGVRFWRDHREQLARIERATGVPPRVIVAILGVETFYGRITGSFRVLDALATLAFDYPPRSSYFRAELEQFLLLAREEGIDPLTVKGSYAGAMGYPQFMPRSYRAYAVDGDADGRRDLWSSADDVMASIANYLSGHGWRAGEPIVATALLPFADAEGLVAGSIVTNETVGSLRDKGLSFDTSLADDAPALFIDVAGAEGPELRAGFQNFAVITRYNRSVMYALAVNDLGEAIESRLAPDTDAAALADAPAAERVAPGVPAAPAAAAGGP
jgi:membrane-bound lytic murein transglycosylase B